MKKVFALILAALLLSACGVSVSEPTMTDAEMATRIAQILTDMPASGTAVPSTAIILQPTLAMPTPLSATDMPLDLSTSTPAIQAATATPTETETPTLTPLPSQTPEPTFTAHPDDPRQKLGNPAWMDKMNDDDNWPTGVNEFSSVKFSDGWMTLKGLTEKYGWRLARTDSLESFYLELTVKPEKCEKLDNYGLFFRVPVRNEADRGYLYGITCDGKYFLRKWDGRDGPDGKMTTLVTFTNSGAILSGAGQTNRLGVMAVDDRLILYVNGVKLKEVKDRTYGQGYFGVFVNPDSTKEFTIRVDQIEYWLNPKP